jgi:hypothetical protein
VRSGDISRTSFRPVLLLSAATGLLAAAAAAAGLFWPGSGEPRTVADIYGRTFELYGRGLYANDTLFAAGNNRGSDLVVIFFGLPLLAVSLWLYHKGSLRGRLVLLGTLGFFLYLGASYAMGAVAYNEMFLPYVALLGTSLYAFVVLFSSFAPELRRPEIWSGLPVKGPAIFMLFSGLATLAIWLMEPVGALLAGEPPASLETRTTLFTHALDLAVIVPAAVTAGVLILRRRPLGYVVAFSLLILETLLLPMIAIATAVQVSLGISFAPGEIAGPIIGFSVLALLSMIVMARLLRRLPTSPAGI